MKASFKLSLGIGLLFLIASFSANAQILQTRSDIITSYGEPFHEGITKDGENFLFYKTPVTTNSSGTYHQRRVLFFKKADDGTEVCYKWKILEPSSETVNNINSFKENLVQIEDKQWKDFAKGIIYQVDEIKGVCKITAWYDNNVDLVKVYKFN